MTWVRCLCGITMLLLLLGQTAPAADEERRAESSYDRYRVVIERNIFSRRRGERRERSPEPARPIPPDPERSVVLNGVVQQGDDMIAFLEDSRTGVTIRARSGDSIVRGRLKALTLDYVEYELEGRVTTVRLGETLEGATPAPVSADAPSPATSDAESARASVERKDAAAILERMRLKRQEELRNQ